MNCLTTLLEITLYSTALFIAIFLFRALLKRHVSPVLMYAIWFLLIARLLMPVTVDAGFHVFTQPASQATDVSALLDGLNNDVALNHNDILAQNQEYSDNLTASENAKAQDTNGAMESATAQESAAEPQTPFTWETVLMMLWLSGAGVMLTLTGISSIRLKRRILRGSGDVPPEWRKAAQQISGELHIRRKLRLVVVSGFPTPALSAGLRPIVVLPKELDDEEAVRFALRHELTHLKRGDHIVCFLWLVLRAVYWFNPVVWIAVKLMRLDMETACDSMVTKPMNAGGKTRYAQAVLALHTQPQVRYVLGMALGSTKKTVERRIKGIFMRNQTGHSVRFATALLAIVMAVACFTTACQPTPEKPVVVGKNQNVMLEKATGAEKTEDTSETEKPFKLADMQIPDTYQFQTTGADDKLTVSADAHVILPDTDTVPTAKVIPAVFSQEAVKGILDYLYGSTPYYAADNRMTKDDITERILQIKKQISEVDSESKQDYIQMQQERIQEFEKIMDSAPDIREEPKLSDGTMPYDEQRAGYLIDVYSQDDKGNSIAHFSSMNCADFDQTTSGFSNIRDDCNMFYSNYYNEDDDYFQYTMDGATRIDEDADISDDQKMALGVTLTQAKALAQGFLDAGGFHEMMCSAVYVMDDHGTGHVDDYTGAASDYAIKLYYSRSVNGVPEIPTSEFAQNARTDYDYTWIYESLNIIVTKDGIADISWYNPCEVTEIITDNTKIITFDEAASIFEKKIMTFYEARVDTYGYDSIDINIDRIELGMMRIKEQNADGKKAGLYVPVWTFCGTTKMTSTEDGNEYVGYNHGCDFVDGPYIVLAVNAIDGSIIDTAQGY